jgi:hypothetical protein
MLNGGRKGLGGRGARRPGGYSAQACYRANLQHGGRVPALRPALLYGQVAYRRGMGGHVACACIQSVCPSVHAGEEADADTRQINCRASPRSRQGNALAQHGRMGLNQLRERVQSVREEEAS